MNGLMSSTFQIWQKRVEIKLALYHKAIMVNRENVLSIQSSSLASLAVHVKGHRSGKGKCRRWARKINSTFQL